MAGLRLLGGLCAAVALALVLDAAVCLLPTNEYQRWQLPGDYFDRRAPWIYERIHFDPEAGRRRDHRVFSARSLASAPPPWRTGSSAARQARQRRQFRAPISGG